MSRFLRTLIALSAAESLLLSSSLVPVMQDAVASNSPSGPSKHETRTPPPPLSALPEFSNQITNCGLWRTDGNFVSIIQIKNSFAAEPIEVLPSLYMADGTEYNLPAVHLAPSAVTTLNINEALPRADSDGAPSFVGHLSAFGSASLRYKGFPTTVRGAISMINPTASLSYIAPFGPPMDGAAEYQVLDGLWWRNDPETGGFLAISNTAEQPNVATVQITGSKGSKLASLSVNLESRQSKMLDLGLLTRGLKTEESNAGGIRVQFLGRLGEVNVVGGMQNARTGYSALMTFWSPIMNEASSTGTVTLSYVGIMTGIPDPMMHFPTGTRFTPYLVLRNTTDREVNVGLDLYPNPGLPVHASSQMLRPQESTMVDMRRVLTESRLKDLNGSLTLAVSHSGTSTDVIQAAGSVDNTGTYVFEVEGKVVSESLSKEVSYWSTQDGADTMIALWNPSADGEDLSLILSYGNRAEQYRLPVHLDAHASTNIDVNDLKMTKIPGRDGRVLPASAREGSIKIENAKGANKPIDVAVNTGIFNINTGTCYYGCIWCNGYWTMTISPGSLDLFVSGTYSLTAYGVYSDGTYYGVSGSSNWSSNNGGVAAVDNYGDVTTSSGGGAQISASTQLPREGQVCAYNPWCAYNQSDANFSATADVTVHIPQYLTVSVGALTQHNGDSVKTPDGQVLPGFEVCYGYSRAYTYQIWADNKQPFTQNGTSGTEINSTTDKSPGAPNLTPSYTSNANQSYFYDMQANCLSAPPGPPTGSYTKGTQQISINVGPNTYANIQANTIDMEATDVSVTCITNCPN